MRLTLLLCVLLAACGAPEGGKRISEIGLDRIEDKDNGVVCYVYRGASVSCVVLK